ncbi:amino acid adenylation domain-containing protein [Candidatus Parabeggiatoa sp. HSG14]|uniref:amino acid adenylation domain-containing protein n=1 Tax=Candidatus Parabeggiatoa sp. HSG14 TaxID=3055593 RepID=UPI0025A71BF6|nr:amino acid adenylation domain-containing protein [Thiotrichales bacterium HSG14]
MNTTEIKNNLSSEEKRILLKKRLREKASKTNQSYPLSYGQQALWLLHQNTPESAAYNVAAVVHICSFVDILALQRILRMLVIRHPSLRTTFSLQDDKPIQTIHGYKDISFEEINVATETLDELNQRVIKAYQQPFDLEQGPLLRVNLFTRTKEDHVLLLTMHHIVTDGWSMWMLMDELFLLYSAQKTGKAAMFSPQRVQYVDFVKWQADMLANHEGEQLWNYWQKQLSGELPVINLPFDKPRPPVQSYNGASMSFQLAMELTQQLKSIAQSANATLYMILLAAFQVLLHRYTGQDDILVGSPTTGRSRNEFTEIVGYFVNMLVLRAKLDNNPTFTTFLSQVRQTVSEALVHQDYPFALLVKHLQPNRDSSRSPIFQISFAFQKPQQSEEISNRLSELFLGTSDQNIRVNLGGIELEPFEIKQQEGQFDLDLEMIETKNTLAGIFKYNTDLFEQATIERMSDHFQTLLTGIVENPLTPVHELPLLTEAEHQQLKAWNDTTADYPNDKCIHQLFEAQVEQNPNAIAVVFEDQELTYLELNIKANQLAHYLKTLGVKPEVLVGICIERSLEMVIGLLGILKAGGAYVSLDPTYPEARLKFMLEDANVPVLLTQSKLVDNLPQQKAQTVCLDTEWEKFSQLSSANLVIGVEPSNLAYVIYTSGSTGRPKGVAMAQKSLVNLIYWQLQQTMISNHAKTLQFAPISFDVSFQEIFSTWCSGGTLVLIAEELRKDSNNFLKFLHEKNIKRLFLPFVALQHLAEIANNEENIDIELREIITAGEQLQIAPEIAQWFQNMTSCTLHNHYGPSESHVVTAFSDVAPVSSWPKLPPIGRPIANTQIYLLDNYQKLVPIGVQGELYIGGVSLARGYLNRQDLTTQKFINNPFDDSDARLYKTGDLARYLPDGNIEYLGRIDNQVKIRGFRIELGEIETTLVQHSDVRETVVIVHEISETAKRLIAFVVAHEGQPIDNTELRGFLKKQLPEYMIPSAFVPLDAIPLTPNGKVDYRTLSQLSVNNYQLSEDTFVAPRTPEEELLAGIWADVLDIERIGVHDNFFELGGHSLIATQIMSRIRETFSCELPLRFLFESPTIAGLSEHLLIARCEEPLPLITPINREEALPLSFAQLRLWFLAQLEGPSATYNMPATLRLEGILNQEALEHSLQTLVHRHETLRTAFETMNGEPVSIIHVIKHWSLGIVDLQQIENKAQMLEVQKWSSREAQRPFDLSAGYLFRTTLLKLKTKVHVLLVNMHHIISDGWSIGVLIRELSTLYEAFSQGQASPLPPLPIQYVDFAHWQRQWLSGKVLEQQINYWKQQLAEIPALLELPTDHPRPPMQRFQGATYPLQLSTKLTAQLKSLSQQTGTTLFMTLLSAFATLLTRYTGSEDIVIGSPIANRTQSQTESLIGFFVNTLVLRIDLSNNPIFEALLKRVRTTALDAYAHQDIPFEQLVEELQPERNLSHTPLFQVMFVLQNAPIGNLELLGLTLAPIEMESVSAKFDLTLSLEETGGGLKGTLEYNTDLFEQTTIERMIGHFQILLTGIVENPLTSVHELSLLTEAEHQQLKAWNNTIADYPTDKCIHQLFEEQAEQNPNATAVVFEDQELTYQELNSKANQLAHHIQTFGIKPEKFVGICVERSLEMVYGLFAILKSGGAYLPLEPTYPSSRLVFLLEDAEASLLLTQEKFLAQFSSLRIPILCLDSGWENFSQEPVTNPTSSIKPNDLAYMIYTSGSTGKPKGVLIEHRGVVNTIKDINQRFSVNSQDSVLALSALNFDLSVYDIFGLLAAGGTVVIPNADIEATKDPAHWVELMTKHQITLWNTVPAFMQMLVDYISEQPQITPKLFHLVLMSGDWIPLNLPKQIKTLWSQIKVISLGGATEASIWSIHYPIEITDPTWKSIPYGKPLANQTFHILNESLAPCPLRVPGYLYIGGIGLARGYWGDKDKTQASFIIHPRTQEKLYKTGDLGRYLPDGNIEFLGRIDNQVKIRGFRIELGEIEAMLAQHNSVRENVVIVHEFSKTNKHLIAFVVAHEGQTIDNSELRGFLTKRLPEYMIPSAFVPLNAIPLTPNGKIDRRKLSQLSVTGYPLSERNFVAPRTPEEELLAGIWADVLGIEQMGVHDNFFEIGGHSLIATQLMSRIRDTFKVELPLRQLFESPTVAELNAQIETIRRKKSLGTEEIIVSLPIIVPTPEQRYQPFPLTDIQQAYWLGRSGTFELGNVATHGYVELECQDLDLVQLNHAWQKLIERHEMLRMIVLPTGQQQIIEQVPPYQITIMDLRGQTPDIIIAELEAIRQLMSHQMLPADQWPLFEIRATRLDKQRTQLHFSFDALIADAWSLFIFNKEWLQLYQNPEQKLTPLALSFRDYVLTEQAWQKTEWYQHSLDYWLNCLDTLPLAPELSLAMNPATIIQPKFHRRSAQLDKDSWQQLKQRASKAGLTPSGVLLAAFADILTLWSKQPRLTLNLTLFNRLPIHQQVNDIVGDFTSLILLAVDNSVPNAFTVRAKRLQQQLWQDLDHRYVNAVRVLRELANKQGGHQRAMMPVVFTSTLSLNFEQDGLALTQLGEVVYSITQTPQVWLDHQVFEQGGALVFNWDAIEDLFPEGMLDNMFEAYCRFLRQLVDSESAWLETNTRALLPPQQLSQRAAINATEASVSDELLHTLFTAQLKSRRHECAVISVGRTLTYLEISKLANQVGQKLRIKGASPNTLVAIVTEKGWEQIVAVLGVLISGAAYLPIDPELPKERQWYLLEQGKVKLVLTQSKFHQNLVWPDNIQRLCLDNDDFSDIDDQPLEVVQKPTDLAYVMFTSGSTGQPKGVMIDHRGAVNTIKDINQRFGVGPRDRVLALSALSFDLSVYDIFGLLATGGTVVIPDADLAKDPAHWIELMNQHQITVWNTVPALMQMLVDYVGERSQKVHGCLRLSMMSGDWIPLNLPEQVKALWPQAQVFSLGGATEASIWSIYYPIETIDPTWKSIPYGKPLNNQTVQVFNELMEPCPIWVPGQFYIGGIGLALGYWRDEDKTQSRFIIHPHTHERLYKTGDLGRYLPDGNIEFLGRVDNQVKIRGFRIELGEIETTLAQQNDVRETVVIVHETTETAKRLIAFVVAYEEQVIDNTKLHGFLKERLPEYMIPSVFVSLEAIPLTPNGKVDRKALSQLSEDSYQLSEDHFVAPRTPEEELLAGIWTDVLGVEQIGVHDNFFELGGHSLLATQVISRIRETLSCELPLRSFFESPTINGLTEYLLTVRHQEPLPLIMPVNRENSLPLSFAQLRLWFLAQLEGATTTYNISAALRLEGILNQEALEQSLQTIVKRHETLRTVFKTVNGEPIQIIRKTDDVLLKIVDLQWLDSKVQEQEVQKLIHVEAQHHFDLSNEPLFRATLFKLEAKVHVLLVNMHHIISDGWSIGVLIRELSTLYEAFSQGQASPLPPLPIQYVDFAHWQRQWLSGKVLEQQINYWKQQLAEIPALLELLTDHPRPPMQRFQGATYPLQLSTKLTAQLKSLSQQTGTTLFMTLLSAFATLLTRYTGSEDIVIGSPIANRTQSQTESLIGFFVNTLVLRIDLSNNPIFEALLKRVRTTALDAYAHQDIPFEQLVEELQPERNLSHTPLFQVMFVLQNAPIGNLELLGLTLAPIEMESVIAKFDLTLSLEETGGGLKGTLEYNTDLFEQTTIERMIGHFQILLTGIVENPLTSVHELSLLTEAEHQQLKAWNNTIADYPTDKCIHQLFEEQAEQNPNATAVVFEDQELTYQELNSKANQLAHHIQTFGIKPEKFVGICVERSLEMVYGLFAILKSGGAYLPLEPTYPSSRLVFLLEDAEASLLLTQEKFLAQFSSLRIPILCLDSGWENFSQEPVTNPTSSIKPNDLAYMIYTSGSTGKPKGVLIEHRGVVNTIKDINQRFSVNSQDSVLALSALNFDLSVYDIFGLLAAGGTVVIPNADIEATKDPAHWVELMTKHQITLWNTVPAFMQMLVDYISEQPQITPKLFHLVLMSGDWIPLNLPKQIKTLWSQIKVISLGGATEASIWSIHYPIEITDPTWKSIPYGKPLANQTFHILNESLAPCPLRVPGYLYIGGIGLARGYWGDKDKTQASFIIHPHTQEKLYKTGDLGRYLPDGNIEFLGRVDNQVKIRGFRIELGEIEAMLAQHNSVRENVVIVHEFSKTNKHLIAFVIIHPEKIINNTELRVFLKERLPEYMIPSDFVQLDSIPLTSNGKIDRCVLESLLTNNHHSKDTYAAPQKFEEKLLADIWIDILGVKKVSIHDNFFELGGDSIISIQMISRANQAGLKIMPRQLFQHQTIAKLVSVIGSTFVDTAEQGLVTGILPLTPIQHWFFEQQSPEPHHFNQAVFLDVSHKLTPELTEQIISQWLQHHDALRLRFSENQEQLITDNNSLITDKILVVKNLSELTTEEQRSVIELTTTKLQASFDLSKEPLLRVALFQLGPELPHRLLFVIHHLAVDGVSWRILLEDFATAYQQLSRGETIKLPPKTTSFKQWAEYLTEYVQSETLLTELYYWLAEARLRVEHLPVDYPLNTETNTVASSAQVEVFLNIEQTQSLLNEIPQVYHAQINDVLLTALVQSFAQWTGQATLLINLEGHGREDIFEGIDLSRTVGWFTSLFPVLLETNQVTQNEGELLKSIKEQLRQVPQRGIGYGSLRYLNPNTASRLSALPQAQVSFNYLGQFQQALSAPPFLGLAKESSGATQSALGQRTHLIDINGLIHEGRLQMVWTYNKQIHKPSTIERLAQDFLKALQALITHCQLPDVGGYTPSDFPEMDLDQEILDDIIEEFSEKV